MLNKLNKLNKNQKRRPVVLAILDGLGVTRPHQANAITSSSLPNLEDLITRFPSTVLNASGTKVGLPSGVMGNSEVCHLSIGSGQIINQSLVEINNAILNKKFYENKAFLNAIHHVRKNKSSLHLLGLSSDGCVHSSLAHLQALLRLAKKEKVDNVYIHAILDGRDAGHNSGLGFIKEIKDLIQQNQIGKIATISGRFYTMDRDNNWDRTERAYHLLTQAKGNKAEDPLKVVEASYKNKIYDEEFEPTVICEEGQAITRISDHDAVIFFNYRADRARQITKAFVLPQFTYFQRDFLKDLFFVSFTEYEKDLQTEAAFPTKIITQTLGKTISDYGFSQLRIAETEKYAHVTYYFNGGREEEELNEKRILVPSLALRNYREQPEMSAVQITDSLVKVVNNNLYDFILVNFANLDMVGHTGDLEATRRAASLVDKCLGRITKSVLDRDGILVITADHGNAEEMIKSNNEIHKEHTTNPVPFVIVGQEFARGKIRNENVDYHNLSLIKPRGVLADVSPTILHLMNIPKPGQMTGESLV